MKRQKYVRISDQCYNDKQLSAIDISSLSNADFAADQNIDSANFSKSITKSYDKHFVREMC